MHTLLSFVSFSVMVKLNSDAIVILYRADRWMGGKTLGEGFSTSLSNNCCGGVFLTSVL